ncbi:hypothetical protein ACXR0O_25535 [Verrucomicrobiota bacterium sgz303538]
MSKDSENSHWFSAGATLLSVFLLIHAPAAIVLLEQWLFKSNRFDMWCATHGVVSVLQPIYRVTLWFLFPK